MSGAGPKVAAVQISEAFVGADVRGREVGGAVPGVDGLKAREEEEARSGAYKQASEVQKDGLVRFFLRERA